MLVTEDVEPGVVRVVSDGRRSRPRREAPDLPLRPRRPMDDIFVTPDSTVWVSSTYSRSDKSPIPGAMVWVLGHPETGTMPDGPHCGTDGLGVSCFDLATETETTYLASTSISRSQWRPTARSGPWAAMTGQRRPVPHHARVGASTPNPLWAKDRPAGGGPIPMPRGAPAAPPAHPCPASRAAGRREHRRSSDTWPACLLRRRTARRGRRRWDQRIRCP